MLFNIYKLLSPIYPFLFSLVAIFNEKARKGHHGRKSQIIKNHQKPVWIHCASHGEYEMIKPIFDYFLQSHKEIVLTFFSPSGYNKFRNSFCDQVTVYYLPYDHPRNAKNFIEQINPEFVIFVKAELWFNFLALLNTSKIPTFVVNAVFTKNNFLLKTLSASLLNQLKHLDGLCLQDMSSYTLLRERGFSNIYIMGNTRVDTVLESKAQNTSEIARIKLWKKNSQLLILGSSWRPEEEMLKEVIETLPSHFKFLIAPHDVGSDRIRQILEMFNSEKPILFSNHDQDSHSRIMIMDKIGYLKQAYKYANAVFIGGGFGDGIHNILEPTVYFIPTAFGPKFEKFPEAVYLSEQKLCTVVKNPENLKTFIIKSLDITYLSKVKEGLQKYFENNRNSKIKILELIDSKIKS